MYIIFDVLLKSAPTLQNITSVIVVKYKLTEIEIIIFIIYQIIWTVHFTDKKRMSHRRGYSEANIEMFKSVQLEFTEGISKSSVSQYNLNINPTATSPTSPPNTVTI